MANFIQLWIGVTLVLTFLCLVNINSLPIDGTPTAVVQNNANTDVEKGYVCNIDTHCNGHGKCRLNETGCDCGRGWTTSNNRNDTNEYCNYQQRSKKRAFFLSLFLGSFGIDWFYLSRANEVYIIAGLLKLLIGCGCCSAWYLTYFRPEIQKSESVKHKIHGVSIFFSLVTFVWWIVDWTRILRNRFPDGRGVGLTPW
ncbi:unnamed protein product [Rotaria sp. Silwood1]|nr:unnamed protein product [Rotaria sp. Silwood1]CAF0954561.1 unnamed protein product [Rotaria sp. Silwood1]CAF3331285.1 unnamed protein product [Rotaria sp. Silwood1]CAF4625893.1 unnamed protein product [Rotaria sp. Silwood1]CAF4981040.1 unnamed protein product [Rotaria sp. Silwood1]